MLRNKKFLKLVFAIITSLLASVVGFWSILDTVWTQLDFQVLDLFFKQAVKSGHTASPSSQVIYLNITDETYHYFGKNILDRVDLAKINNALAEFEPEAVGYDIIFARPSHPAVDSIFTQSLKNLGCVYLPTGFELSDEARPFKWEPGKAYARFQTAFLKKPIEQGKEKPIYGIRALMQMDDFAEAAFNSGDISAANDPDGVYRHMAMVLKSRLALLSLALVSHAARLCRLNIGRRYHSLGQRNQNSRNR